MRKRLRTVGAPEPFCPVTQIAWPNVAARSPAPSVDCAAISAWVSSYTEDAIFVGPGAPAIEGRRALLEVAPQISISSMAVRSGDSKAWARAFSAARMAEISEFESANSWKGYCGRTASAGAVSLRPAPGIRRFGCAVYRLSQLLLCQGGARFECVEDDADESWSLERTN
jgi:hypothetical protein